MRSFATALLSSLLMLGVSGAIARAQHKVEEFFDTDYGYFFKYPAGWAIRKLPEGPDNPDVRVMLQGPNGSSFMVVTEKLAKKTTREGVDSDPERKKIIDAMVAQTVEQTYKVISQNIQAKEMILGERRDLTNGLAIKFYLATRHSMAKGKPIIVAGIHTFPFDKDYSINFIMTAFFDPAAKQEQQTLTAIFNSFHLFGENVESPGAPDRPAQPPP